MRDAEDGRSSDPKVILDGILAKLDGMLSLEDEDPCEPDLDAAFTVQDDVDLGQLGAFRLFAIESSGPIESQGQGVTQRPAARSVEEEAALVLDRLEEVRAGIADTQELSAGDVQHIHQVLADVAELASALVEAADARRALSEALEPVQTEDGPSLQTNP